MYHAEVEVSEEEMNESSGNNNDNNNSEESKDGKKYGVYLKTRPKVMENKAIEMVISEDDIVIHIIDRIDPFDMLMIMI